MPPFQTASLSCLLGPCNAHAAIIETEVRNFGIIFDTLSVSDSVIQHAEELFDQIELKKKSLWLQNRELIGKEAGAS